jgi:hypothetical protein
LAEFHTAPFNEAIGPNDILERLVAKPRMFTTRIFGANRGTAVLGITDRGAQQMMEAEASQLPREAAGALVLDVSSVINGVDEWCPLIEQRFQPSINTRIGAVVLMDRALHEDGLITTGRVLLNPYARKPLSSSSQTLLHGIFN